MPLTGRQFTVRPRRLRAAVALVVAAGLVVGLSGAGRADSDTESSRLTAQEISSYLDVGQHNGRTLVRGFFFLSGPLVKYIPELREARKHAEEAGYKLDVRGEQQVLNAIQAAAPGFYKKFAAEMTSGDHVRVSQALSEASDVVLAAVAEVTGTDGDSVGTYASLYIAVVAIMGVVSVAWLALGGTVMVTAMVTFWDGSSGDSSVPKDRVVDTVVKRLGAATDET